MTEFPRIGVNAFSYGYNRLRFINSADHLSPGKEVGAPAEEAFRP